MPDLDGAGRRVKSRSRKRPAERYTGTLDAVSATAAEPSAPPPPTGGSIRGHLWERFGHLVHELGKFGVVGTAAFVVDVTIYNLLLARHTETLIAKTVAALFATTVAFLGNRFWTWRHRHRGNLAREYTSFLLLNAAGIGIGLACLGISHYGLGQIWPALQSRIADNIAGLVIGTGFGTLFRFWSYRTWVFRALPAKEAVQTAESFLEQTEPVPSPRQVRRRQPDRV